MTDLPRHAHVCPDCQKATVHHKWPHEDIGELVDFWCDHCETDVLGWVGGRV